MIYIKELLPNPAGKDAAGEWIKLFNDSSSPVTLNGWSLRDVGGKVFKLDRQTISASGDLKLAYNETRITLNNDADSVYLSDASGKEVDKLSYNGITEGQTVTAAQFKTNQTARVEASIISPNTQGASATEFNFKETYDFWPLVLGLFLAVLSGLVSVYIFKFLNKR